MSSHITRTCAVCGQALADQCCDDAAARRDHYRQQQEDRKTLFAGLGIEIRENPSHELAGEREIVPHLPSLIAFLAELPFGPPPCRAVASSEGGEHATPSSG